MRKFYCSSCGIELTYIRKAIPGKGYITNMINPHECEGFAIKETTDGKETLLQIIENLKPIGRAIVAKEDKDKPINQFNPGDHRDDKSKITSSAPASILSSVKSMSTSNKELDDDM